MSVRPLSQPRQLQSSDLGLDWTHDCELDRHAGWWVVSNSGERERRCFLQRKEDIVGDREEVATVERLVIRSCATKALRPTSTSSPV